MVDVAIVGAGIAGMATAARLQARGLRTLVLEAHGQVGGCAGFFRRKGFAFDVGATTLVDFAPGGVGGELLDAIGMLPLRGEHLPGYVAHLPDRRLMLHRDPARWDHERRRVLGDTPAHRAFWGLLDQLAEVFWAASRRGVRLPLRDPADILDAARALGLAQLPLARYLRWTLGDALRAYGLRDDLPLVGLLAMLVEDTVHSRVDAAPLINAALGITIRGAGLSRTPGGMWGFWQAFVARYRALGGELRVGCAVERITGHLGAYEVVTRRGTFQAAQVVSAIPIASTAALAPPAVGAALAPYLRRDANALGGALVVFLGVPEHEIANEHLTHHQLLQDYTQPLGDGNNMFISVSSPGDTASAPAGHRAVMISTHCALEPWEGLSAEAYAQRKQTMGTHLITLARRVYPQLGHNALVCEVGTPQSYACYTHRPRGAVGGVQLSLANANQRAVPHEVGVPGFWLVGDTTWPGLGTVACVLGSRIVAEGVLRLAAHQTARRQHSTQEKERAVCTASQSPK
jgi:C-3',4' desaturase CrtD